MSNTTTQPEPWFVPYHFKFPACVFRKGWTFTFLYDAARVRRMRAAWTFNLGPEPVSTWGDPDHG